VIRSDMAMARCARCESSADGSGRTACKGDSNGGPTQGRIDDGSPARWADAPPTQIGPRGGRGCAATVAAGHSGAPVYKDMRGRRQGP